MRGRPGIIGVMLEACREVGIPAISLWAATPHYLAANPNPAGCCLDHQGGFHRRRRSRHQ